MSPQDRKFEKPMVVEGRIRCRRVDATYTPEQHEDCPYCFGRVADVRTGAYERFCDFRPGEDPICFGFPAETSRNQQG